MSTLERAIAIAATAHAGQVDKAGAPYILHPLRVMLAMPDNDSRIVAVLHDLCEDCPGWSLEKLRMEGFPPRIVNAIEAVTKRDGETYEDFVRRAGANPIGRAVKRADLRDNMNLSRIPDPGARDLARVAKYHEALAVLDATEPHAVSGSSHLIS
jgi:(p)ppGpp synthase/HD superfamily hydrolase